VRRGLGGSRDRRARLRHRRADRRDPARSAEDLERALAEVGELQADLVVSGIPFSTLERGLGRRTLEAAQRVLAPGGRFVAYQFRSHVRRMAEPLFGPADVHPEFRNVPPMRVYVWRADPSRVERARAGLA
jgi:phospholipid N-methyltransferase